MAVALGVAGLLFGAAAFGAALWALHRLEGLSRSVEASRLALEQARRAASERGWEALVGGFVMVNDDQGDGYCGLLVAVSDRVLRLESSAGRPVRFIDGKNGKAEELVEFVNLPAARVKFVTGVS